MYSSHVRRCAALCLLFATTTVLSGDPPAVSTPAPPAKPAPSVEDRIQQALDSRQPFECKDLLIPELPAYLKKQYGIPVVVDAQQIDTAGKKESTVSLATKNASLRACLNIILAPHELGYKIADEALVITTREQEIGSLRTEVFPVGQFTAGPAHQLGELEFDNGLEWDDDSLVELITTSIYAPSWDQAGGAGSARIFRDLLVVSQRNEVLDEVKKLLAALDSAKKLDRAASPEVVAIDSDDLLTKRLRATLDRKARLSVTEQPLSEVIRQLSDLHDLPFLFDRFELEHVGKGPDDVLISLNLADVSLRGLLRQLLSPHELGFVIRNEHFFITTKEVERGTLTVRVYPVRDLVTRDAGRDDSLDYEWLKEVISTTVQPPTWDSAGGAGSFRELAQVGALVIAQTHEVHEEVGQLLKRLRQVRRDQSVGKQSGKVSAENGMFLRFYRIDFPSEAGAKADTAEATAKSPPSSTADVAILIRDLVEPESWKKEPQAYIRAVGDRLVIRHRRAVHRQIDRLIEKLISAPIPPDNQVPMVGSGAPF